MGSIKSNYQFPDCWALYSNKITIIFKSHCDWISCYHGNVLWLAFCQLLISVCPAVKVVELQNIWKDYLPMNSLLKHIELLVLFHWSWDKLYESPIVHFKLPLDMLTGRLWIQEVLNCSWLLFPKKHIYCPQEAYGQHVL